jgi:acetyltransferase-like isoleucine patch superfamily enzyme
VYIGSNTHIAPNCTLSGLGGLYIGHNCGVAANSAIYSFSHHYRNLVDRTDDYQYVFSPMVRLDQQAMIRGAIFIDDYCAIGLNSLILPGVSLMRGTWIGGGLIITESTNSQTLAFSKNEISMKSLSNLKIKT